MCVIEFDICVYEMINIHFKVPSPLLFIPDLHLKFNCPFDPEFIRSSESCLGDHIDTSTYQIIPYKK